ncbi:MAG: ATP synthase subunit I [Anaerolineaceae bacterium]|nr:ATP synthase subunit I [Anaerolineaceae bacterium]
MNPGNIISILTAFAGGLVVGLIYFWSLKYVVSHMLTSKHPALVMIGSYFLRTVFMLLAFYLIMDGELIRLLACFVGFILVRIIIIRGSDPKKPMKI